MYLFIDWYVKCKTVIYAPVAGLRLIRLNHYKMRNLLSYVGNSVEYYL